MASIGAEIVFHGKWELISSLAWEDLMEISHTTAQSQPSLKRTAN